MYQHISVKLLNLLLSLSDALDLASPKLSQHQLRVAYIAREIGKEVDIPAEYETDLFIAALLHDVGALTPEDKIKVRNNQIFDNEPHCVLSEKFLSSIGLFDRASHIARYHHINWRTMSDSLDEPIATCAQILSLADAVERHIDRRKFILHQDQEIKEDINSLADERGISPDIVGVFCDISAREEFWLDFTSSRLYSILLNDDACRGIEIDITQLLPISEMFRNLIDFRSRFTATHSSGVATTAATLSRLFGFTESEVELMEVAGNLHDLGKMAVPNSILAKPGKLTTEEYAIMRQHTYHTYAILNTIGGIQDIAEWAAFHHERLDGSGYPFRVSAKYLGIKSRIMAVADVFTALAETRPYRAGMPQDEILSVLKNMCARNSLDPNIVDLLDKNYDEVVEITKKRQAEVLNFYETEFSSTCR